MQYYFVVYSSVTLANRVKKNIRKDGSYLSVIHAPKTITKGGCSYALKFKPIKLSEVRRVSDELNIKIRGIFKEELENGEKVYTQVT